MTTATGTTVLPARSKAGYRSNAVPVLIVLLVLLVLWYLGAIGMNAPGLLDTYRRTDVTNWSISQFVLDSWSQSRPVLPAPHQVFAELWASTALVMPTVPRSLLFHAGVTLSTTVLGFAFGTLLGIALAVLIVHNDATDRSLMPWVIASQTIPILALAPMIIVVLNTVGVSGLVPKALISTYLSFFPVVVGMVKGLRSPERIQLDLMRTYNASAPQTFFKLRWPASLPFLFASMKVAVAASLVGAIVAELPTGAVAGLGARLLSGSYRGQILQIWSALFAAAIMAALLVLAVGLVERLVNRSMGMRPA